MGLLDILKKLPDPNEIKGGFGEYLVKYYSKYMFVDTPLLHDVLIHGADGMTSQIDLIMVGEKGLYIIEVKNYENAMIYGDAKKSKWYYYRGGKKFDIYSPVKQNIKHTEYIKEFLKDFGDVPCFSIVAMLCKDYKMNGHISEDINNPTCGICNGLFGLTDVIKLISKNKPVVFTGEQQKEIYEYIKNNQIAGKEARQEHKEKLISIKDEQQSLKDQKICPYCKTPLVLRKGKYGDFYGCTNYPKCRYTQKT